MEEQKNKISEKILGEENVRIRGEKQERLLGAPAKKHFQRKLLKKTNLWELPVESPPRAGSGKNH